MGELNYPMNVEDNDWFDQRLAVKESYVPDDGFTAHVLGRLPKKQTATVRQIRWRVLSLSIAIACVLFLLQIVPVLQNLNPLLNHYASSVNLDHLVKQCERPAVLIPAAGSLTLIACAAIPLLRRWV